MTDKILRQRSVRRAMLAGAAMLAFSGAAFAQTVPVFDEAPSMAQLRSIMIPQSTPGTGRSIVLQRPDAASHSAVQQAATKVALPSAQQPAPESQPVQQAAARVVTEAPAAAPAAAPQDTNQNDAAGLGVVGLRINFAFGQATLPASADVMVERILALMQEMPELRLRIEGHTDSIGSVAYNLSLSEKRAFSVGAYLVRHGIAADRLTLIGKGMSEPLVANPADARNRRVQFVRLG